MTKSIQTPTKKHSFVVSESRYQKGSYTILDTKNKEEYRLYSSENSAKKDLKRFVENKEWEKYQTL